MTRKSKKTYLIRKPIEPRKRFEKPFWLSSLNYYILTIGVTIAFFFLIWGILHAAEEEMPWITAGIVAGLILISAVILRELVFKRTYQKTLLAQKRLDYNIKSLYKPTNQKQHSNRLTLERNAAIINEIENKSQKAKSLGKLPELHLEVFEMCREYLQKSSREIEGLLKSSPRYEAIRQGQRKLQNLHRFHLLSWASIESQLYVQTAKVQVGMSDKIENAQRALVVLDTAMQFYPDEQKLIESTEAIKGFIISIKVSHWMEQGERAAFKHHYRRAINHYRDALFFLARENERTSEHEMMAEKINLRIEELRKNADKNK